MSSGSPGDRRPIATRNLKWAEAMAHWLVLCRASPNAISVFGMLCCLAAGLLLAATDGEPGWSRWAWIAAAALIQLRLLANMFDGMVAIESGRVSAVGELYNDVPDRVSDAAVLIGLGYAEGSQIELGYLAALLAVLTAYIRVAGKAAGAHQEFCGPMAKPQRMFVITILALFCGLVPAGWQSQLPLFPSLGWPAMALVLIVAGSLVTCLRRLVRIAAALRRNQR